MALLSALIAILIYIGFRFEWRLAPTLGPTNSMRLTVAFCWVVWLITDTTLLPNSVPAGLIRCVAIW
jgi:preprotein translocase subunit SecF